MVEIYIYVPKKDPTAVMNYKLRKLEGGALVPTTDMVKGSVIGSKKIVLEKPSIDSLVRIIEEEEGATRVEVFGVDSNENYIQLPSDKPLTLIFYKS